MHSYEEPLVVRRHEVKLQQLRQERKSEKLHLEKMKASLVIKLKAPPAKNGDVRAA